MQTVRIDLGTRSYPIYIGKEALAQLPRTLKEEQFSSILIVSNTTVAPLYLDQVRTVITQALPQVSVHSVILPDGECFKDLAHISKILDAAQDAKLDRKSVMIALGGGVIGDMTGFAASMWMRGIAFIQIPTTLLAQVDSSVGGKTGVNLPTGKNLIGAFHQPVAVFIDPEVLKTLPTREISAGVAEVIKYGLLGDADFVKYLQENMGALRALDERVTNRVIAHCCSMKAEVVRADERECGERAKLNLGHTFGHAIEKLTGYSTWLHGEAVGVGMVMAADLSAVLGYITEHEVKVIRELVESAGLPVHIECLDSKEAYRAMQGDKKSVAGTVRFVVMKAIGQTEIESVDRSVIDQVMARAGWGEI